MHSAREDEKIIKDAVSAIRQALNRMSEAAEYMGDRLDAMEAIASLETVEARAGEIFARNERPLRELAK